MVHLKASFVCMWLAFALLCVAPLPYGSEAYADAKPEGMPVESNLQTVDKDGNVVKCADAVDANGMQLGKGALLGTIMPCLIYTVEKSTVRFTAEMVSTFRPLLYSFLAVVIVLFGVRVLQNEPQIHKQGFVLILKLTIVLALLNDLGGTHSISNVANSGTLIPAVYKIMNEAQSIVMIKGFQLNSSSMACDVATYSTGHGVEVWSMMDCVVGKLFGITVGADGKANMLLATSMIGLIVGFLFSGTWGIAVFFGMLGVLFGLFMLVLRTATIFISSYLLICLMLIISPLLMPLVFLKSTERYFEKFWKLILASFVMPIIVTSYVVISLLIYDKMLFEPSSMVQKIFKWDVVENALEPDKTPVSFTYTNNGVEHRLGDATGNDAARDKLMQTPTLWNLMMPALSGGGLFGIKVSSLNFEKLGPQFEKGKESYKKIFEELVQLLVLAWLINQGLNQLSGIAQRLAGSRAALQAMQGVDRLEKGAMASGKEALQKMNSSYKEKSSSTQSPTAKQFAERSQTAANEGMTAFMDAMKKNAKNAPEKK
jgi:hypothetical protein